MPSILHMVHNMTWSESFCQGTCAIVKYAVPRHTWMYHMEEITKKLCHIYRNGYEVVNWVEWMKGISLIWSRGRLISPSLPVGDDWYLNLSSQKRSPGRNLGEHRSVRRSGTASRGTALLVFGLRMRSISRTLIRTTILGKYVCKGSTKFHTQVVYFIMCIR